MVLDLDREFIIVKQKPADQLREATGRWDLSMEDVRHACIMALGDAVCSREYPSVYGLTRVCDVTFRRYGVSGQAWLIWGRRRDGSPQLAPDGKKQIVFVDCLVLR